VTPWLKTLDVEDFRSILGPVRVSLDAPVVLIQGANGTGKTSLLSALELALTRSVADSGKCMETKDLLLAAIGEDRLDVGFLEIVLRSSGTISRP
jgi:DNA repair exonuclease SbcCD ATPase subunit